MNSNDIICIMIAFVSLSVLATRGIPLIRKIPISIRRRSGEIHLDKRSKVTSEQWRKLAVGAIFSQQQGAYINSFKTGIGGSYLRAMLSEWWDIDSRDSALDTLEHLQVKGIRFYYPTVVRALGLEDKQLEEMLIESFDNDEDRQRAYSQLQNLTESLPSLKDDGIISSECDLAKIGAAGWDCDRLVFVSRACFDAGYIGEVEAWRAIDSAAEYSKKLFASRNDFARSYIVGRAIWGGAGMYNVSVVELSKRLLEDPKSPWVQLPW